MSYSTNEMRWISRAMTFALVSHAERGRPIDFLFKPGAAGNKLVIWGCPIDVVIAAICSDVSNGSNLDLKENELCCTLGYEAVQIIKEISGTRSSPDWCERQRFKLERVSKVSLEACVVLAARQLANLEFSNDSVDQIAATVTEGEAQEAAIEDFFQQFKSPGQDYLRAYNILLVHLLLKRVDRTDDFELMTILDRVTEDIPHFITDLWPGMGMSLEQAASLLQFSLEQEQVLESLGC